MTRRPTSRAEPVRPAAARRRCLWRGAAAGALGGLVGSVAMTGFLQLLRALDPRARRHPQHSLFRGLQRSARGVGITARDDATTRLADRAARLALGRRLRRKEKRLVGPAVHYLFGGVVGSAYGALVEILPRARGGLRLGGVVWLLADFTALPLLGVTPPPWRTPAGVHARGLASHVPFGVATESVRRWLRGGET